MRNDWGWMGVNLSNLSFEKIVMKNPFFWFFFFFFFPFSFLFSLLALIHRYGAYHGEKMKKKKEKKKKKWKLLHGKKPCEKNGKKNFFEKKNLEIFFLFISIQGMYRNQRKRRFYGDNFPEMFPSSLYYLSVVWCWWGYISRNFVS